MTTVTVSDEQAKVFLESLRIPAIDSLLYGFERLKQVRPHHLADRHAVIGQIELFELLGRLFELFVVKGGQVPVLCLARRVQFGQKPFVRSHEGSQFEGPLFEEVFELFDFGFEKLILAMHRIQGIRSPY